MLNKDYIYNLSCFILKDVITSYSIHYTKLYEEMMAGKARLLSEIIERALTSDEENEENSYNFV